MNEKKGICITCENDLKCSFPRKNPVWNCEEFKVIDVKVGKREIQNTESKQKK